MTVPVISPIGQFVRSEFSFRAVSRNILGAGWRIVHGADRREQHIFRRHTRGDGPQNKNIAGEAAMFVVRRQGFEPRTR